MAIGPGYGCVPCSTYFRPKKNGIYVLETYEDGYTPYKVWQADLLECPDCRHQIIMGYGLHAISEQYMEDFQTWLDLVSHTIKGCPKMLPSERNELARLQEEESALDRELAHTEALLVTPEKR